MLNKQLESKFETEVMVYFCSLVLNSELSFLNCLINTKIHILKPQNSICVVEYVSL